MKNKYSERLIDVIEYSREEAGRLQNTYIGPEHLMLGIIRDGSGKAYQLLEDFHVDPFTIKRLIEQEIKNTVDSDYSTQEITVSKTTERVLRMSDAEARNLHKDQTDTEHLLLAIIREEYNVAARILMDAGISYSSLFEKLREESEPNYRHADHEPELKTDIQTMMKKMKMTTSLVGTILAPLLREMRVLLRQNRLMIHRYWIISVLI